MTAKITIFARMNRGRYLMDNIPPFVQLLLIISLSSMLFLLFSRIGMYMVRPLFGVTTIDVVMENAIKNRELVASHTNEVNALKFLQFMSSLGAFLLPGLIFAWSKFPGGDYLKLNTRISGLLLLMGIVLIIVVSPFISLTYEINQLLDLPASMDAIEKQISDLEHAANELTMLLITMKDPIDLVVNILVIALIPALAEELFFRGCIQQVFKEWFRNPHVAIWTTAIIFSFFHFEFYGFIPRLLLGALLGYLFFWSGSLWVPIIAHMIQNGAQVLLVYLHERGLTSIDVFSDDSLPVSLVIASVIGTTALVYVFRRVSDNHKFIY